MPRPERAHLFALAASFALATGHPVMHERSVSLQAEHMRVGNGSDAALHDMGVVGHNVTTGATMKHPAAILHTAQLWPADAAGTHSTRPRPLVCSAASAVHRYGYSNDSSTAWILAETLYAHPVYELVPTTIPMAVPATFAIIAAAYMIAVWIFDAIIRKSLMKLDTSSSLKTPLTDALGAPVAAPPKPEGGAPGGAPPGPQDLENRPLWERATFIALAVCVSFLGELFYGLPVSFLPGEASARGISVLSYSFIISAFAFGVLPTSLFASTIMRHFEPYTVLNVTLTVQCICAFVQAMCGYIEDKIAFTVIMILARCIMGCAMAFNETVRGYIVVSMVPKSKAGYVQGITWAIRNIGTFVAPSVGGVLYTAGGLGFAYFFGGCLLFLFNMIQTTLICMTPDPPQRNSKQSSFAQIMSIPMVYACLFSSFSNGLVAYALEPLYEMVLSVQPYHLDVDDIGLFSSILALGWSSGFFLIGTWAVIYFGDLKMQNIGMVIRCVGLLFLGPLFGIPGSRLLFGIMAFIVGVGATTGGPAAPQLAYKVLDANGMPKAKVGGALSAVLLFLQYLGAFMGPLIGGTLEVHTGFPIFCLVWAILLAVLYVPCAICLIPYEDPGTCFAKPGKA